MPEVLKFGQYSVQSPDIREILKDSLQRGHYDSYKNNAHNDGSVRLTEDDPGNSMCLEALCQKIYKRWFKIMTAHGKSPAMTAELDTAYGFSNLVNNPQLSVENMSERSAYDFFAKDYQNFGVVKYTRPVLAQNNRTIADLRHERDDGFFEKGDFIHVFPNGEVGEGRDKIDCRLYINFKSENLLAFVNELIGKALKTNTKLPYFKFYTRTDNRNDDFLIYSSFEKAEQNIDLIEQVKAEHPELFDGTENMSRNLGKINGYIGYGDEPTKEMSGESYNTVRENVTDDFISHIRHNSDGKIALDENLVNEYEKTLQKNGIESNFCLNKGTKEKVEEIYKNKHNKVSSEIIK